MNTSVSHWSIADPSDIKGVFMIDGRPKGLDEWKIFRFSNFTQGIIAKMLLHFTEIGSVEMEPLLWIIHF